MGGAGTQTVNSVAAKNFYFCIPSNDQFLGYWDTVADRLYKIRHCMTIQGVVEQLALFAPPINPAILVEAKAMGVDLSSVLNDFNVPVPNYRFNFVLQKAVELCAEVRSLGSSLLSVLEKSDAEALSVLRTTQEVTLLQAAAQIKQSQIDEANNNLAALQASQGVTQYRQSYYRGLITAGLSGYETAQVAALSAAQVFKTIGQVVQLLAPVGDAIPDETVGDAGIAGPVALTTYGGRNLATGASDAAQAMAMVSDIFSFIATMAALTGSWDRRSQEWNFQLQTATKELGQIQSQIDAANVRVQIAQQDFQNHQIQIVNAQAVLDYLNSKYTNQELYQWMASQISACYFECYQLAYGLAKRAEYCFRFELGLTTSNYIQFGYWDTLRMGLLAGEGLYRDLKRLEMTYLDQNKREYEITKYISLVLLDPIALITLKESGQCPVSLPEALFDTDYPGHYLRRIKSVSLTIPCVTGPYTSVNCTLTLQSNQTRIDNVASSVDDYRQPSHFLTSLAATQSIATSSAQNDNGMFELNFRDERYLPFEGAGVISTWQIQLPQDCNAFDFETITDVVINLKYTARDGGDALRAVAKQAGAQQRQGDLPRFFSLRHEFPTEWYRFLHPVAAAPSQDMQMSLGIERFPFQYRGKKINFSQVELLLKFKNIHDTQRFITGTPLGDFVKGSANAGSLNVYISSTPFVPGQQPQPPTWPVQNATNVTLNSMSTKFNGTPYKATPLLGTLATWWLQVFTTNSHIGNVASTLLDSDGHILADIVEDMYVVIHYSAA
jgi:Tc toxin complex TcA C-terminal TcB-binding domain